ncbi:hypothetical protein EK904_013721 [Melospiza melodia maxima]|nr:hypothetical protein EK904_013721 [Melospiza melodia maxima]
MLLTASHYAHMQTHTHTEAVFVAVNSPLVWCFKEKKMLMPHYVPVFSNSKNSDLKIKVKLMFSSSPLTHMVLLFQDAASQWEKTAFGAFFLEALNTSVQQGQSCFLREGRPVEAVAFPVMDQSHCTPGSVIASQVHCGETGPQPHWEVGQDLKQWSSWLWHGSGQDQEFSGKEKTKKQNKKPQNKRKNTTTTKSQQDVKQHDSKIGERSVYCILQMYIVMILMSLEFCMTHERLSWQWNAVNELPCCSVAKQLGVQRILELMNGDKLPFPQITRICCFSLWLLSLQYSPESIWFVVVMLTPSRQCFLFHEMSGTHRKHTEEQCSKTPNQISQKTVIVHPDPNHRESRILTITSLISDTALVSHCWHFMVQLLSQTCLCSVMAGKLSVMIDVCVLHVFYPSCLWYPSLWYVLLINFMHLEPGIRHLVFTLMKNHKRRMSVFLYKKPFFRHYFNKKQITIAFIHMTLNNLGFKRQIKLPTHMILFLQFVVRRLYTKLAFRAYVCWKLGELVSFIFLVILKVAIGLMECLEDMCCLELPRCIQLQLPQMENRLDIREVWGFFRLLRKKKKKKKESKIENKSLLCACMCSITEENLKEGSLKLWLNIPELMSFITD